MPIESARSRYAREDIDRLVHQITVTRAHLQAHFDSLPTSEESVTVLALRLANAAMWLNQEATSLLDEESVRIREADRQRRDDALHAATAAAP